MPIGTWRLLWREIRARAGHPLLQRRCLDGFKDLASGQIETRDLSSFLGTTFGNDVVYLSDDAIFASPDQPCCDTDAFLVRTSRSDPVATRRAAGGIPFAGTIYLTPSPAGDFLYASSGRLFKLDLNAPDEPVVRTWISSESWEPFRSFISPDGERILGPRGFLLRTSDLFQVGQVGYTWPGGATAYSSDGASIYKAAGSNTIDRHDPWTLQATGRFASSSSCFSAPWQLVPGVSGNRIIAASQITVCFWMLDQPTAGTHLKVGMHSAYVCGAACLTREYERRTGSSLSAWQRGARSRDR